MYDIYIYQGGKILPEINDFIDTIPELANQEIQSRMLHGSREFLGLNLSLDIAKKLTWQLRYTKARARCQVIPTGYRDNEPNFTLETAYPIAERALKEQQITKYPNLHFSEVIYGPGYSGIMYITFLCSAKEWQDEGLIPGAIFVRVDRLDGHVWGEDEGDELYV